MLVCHKCQQVVFVDDSGNICRIVHIDLAGEGAALDAFFTRYGVVRPQQESTDTHLVDGLGEH